MTNSTRNARGLAALIPTDTPLRVVAAKPAEAAHSAPLPGGQAATASAEPTKIEGLTLISVSPRDIVPNAKQPRTEFDEDALAELATSLQQIGFLQPIVVRERGKGKYELVAGERRWRASKAAGFETIPALVRSTDDDAMLRDALLENLQRAALNPLEEAAAYAQLLSDFGGTHDELAARLGRSRPQVSNTLRLLKLPTPVQRRVAAGVLSAGHARALLSLDNGDAMDAMAKRVIAEGISVRALEEIVSVGETDTQGRPPRISRKTTQLPELDVVAERLGNHLDTRVSVTMGKTKGRISIDFAGIEDLHRLVTELTGPEAS